MSDFLNLGGKTFLVMGVANRKSVAWFIAKSLEEQGARVVYSVRSETRKLNCEVAKRSAASTSAEFSTTCESRTGRSGEAGSGSTRSWTTKR